MNVLVACEESQAVCTEFRKLGHNAFSCDIVPCSGGHLEWHIMQDVLPLLNGNCMFTTMNDELHVIEDWDLIIAFPPCTYLTVTGNRWFNVERYGFDAINRQKQREHAIAFFMAFLKSNCKHLAIENPVGIMSTVYAKPTQIIQPYMFGEPFEKKTCLWLRNLPGLEPTEIVTPPPRIVFKSGKSWPAWYYNVPTKDPVERAKLRSKTFPGIARAMAEQWSKYLANIPSS